MNLFYFPDLKQNDTVVDLKSDEVQHIVKVLRNGPGDELIATNGEGWAFRLKILETSKKSIRCEVLNSKLYDRLSHHNLHIGLGVLRLRDRLEFAIEKSVELGVGGIHLIITDRSERSKIKLDRLEAIASSAMKQSLQVYRPIIEIHDSLDAFLKSFSGAIIAAHEMSTAPIQQLIHPTILEQKLGLLIGPEGGFSDRETGILKAKNVPLVSLGPIRMRAETALVKLISIVNNAAAEANGLQLYKDPV
jgi:16S rRNA (uracil1498-N3)-methyltransferase